MPAKRKSPVKVGLNISDQASSAFKPHAEVADQVALEVVNHVDQQYPAMWERVPKTARVSLRNFVYNQVLLAVGNAVRDAEKRRQDSTEVVRIDAVGDRCVTVTRAVRQPGTLNREDEARAAAARGEAVLAIKILNHANGISLREAKDTVEGWIR